MKRGTGKDFERSKHQPSDISGYQSSIAEDPSLLGCHTVLLCM
jgi:hypothetical protein